MFQVATDGACKGNPGPGTWAFVVFDQHGNKCLGHKKGHEVSSTNNVMELTAILQALAWAFKHKKAINILTDSNYCYKGITEWLPKWKANGWRTASGAPVKNAELWKKVHLGKNTIEKVKGHSGHHMNEMADMYCNEEYINKFL